MRHEVGAWDGGGSSDDDSLSVVTVFYPSGRVIRSEETLLLVQMQILFTVQVYF